MLWRLRAPKLDSVPTLVFPLIKTATGSWRYRSARKQKGCALEAQGEYTLRHEAQTASRERTVLFQVAVVLLWGGAAAQDKARLKI